MRYLGLFRCRDLCRLGGYSILCMAGRGRRRGGQGCKLGLSTSCSRDRRREVVEGYVSWHLLLRPSSRRCARWVDGEEGGFLWFLERHCRCWIFRRRRSCVRECRCDVALYPRRCGQRGSYFGWNSYGRVQNMREWSRCVSFMAKRWNIFI